MASFRKDGILYDPLTRVSRSVDKAVNMNRDLAQDNVKKLRELEKEKQKSLREITKLQKSLENTSISNKKLAKYNSFDVKDDGSAFSSQQDDHRPRSKSAIQSHRRKSTASLLSSKEIPRKSSTETNREQFRKTKSYTFHE